MATILKVLAGSHLLFRLPTDLTKGTVRFMGKLKIRRLPKPPHVDKKFDWQIESLSARGFLRSQKAYDPPNDVVKKLSEIFIKYNIADLSKTLVISDPAVRFNVLNECFLTFNHEVPNSLLHTIHTKGDIIEFYKTPVDTRTPYEALQNMDLPKNLHVQQNYHRFNPDTDTMFNGISAFPKSSTLVTGLKYRKKYEGFIWKKKED